MHRLSAEDNYTFIQVLENIAIENTNRKLKDGTFWRAKVEKKKVPHGLCGRGSTVQQ